MIESSKPIVDKKTGIQDDYDYLISIPQTPSQEIPNRSECEGFEYLSMVQFCDIAETHGLSRNRAYIAFGGDRGKYKVEPARRARVAMDGKRKRKYVLVSAAIDYFAEERINW